MQQLLSNYLLIWCVSGKRLLKNHLLTLRYNFLLFSHRWDTGRGGLVGRLHAVWLVSERSRDRLSHTAHSFVEKGFPSSADSTRANCRLVAKEWSLNTGKLSAGGLPKNSVVK